MIYTVTLNPSIDLYMSTDAIRIGKTNRALSETTIVGGKGINVSRVLRELQKENVALGFIAGGTGDLIEKGLEGILKTDLIRLPEGDSRINVKLSRDKEITEINGIGPSADSQSLDMLRNKLSELSEDDMVILSGTPGPGVSEGIYGDLTAILDSKGVRFALDTSPRYLKPALKNRPFVIKPNTDELGGLFDMTIDPSDTDRIYELSLKLQEEGAREVIVSAGSFGAYLTDEKGGFHMVTAFKGDVINTVGAGDSLLAGFIAKTEESKDHASALEFAVACGCACAFSRDLPDRQDIMRLLGC